MQLFWPVDLAVCENDLNPRLPVETIRELNAQMNCNLYDSADNELWFELEDIPDHIRTITDEEFVNEYVD